MTTIVYSKDEVDALLGAITTGGGSSSPAPVAQSVCQMSGIQASEATHSAGMSTTKKLKFNTLDFDTFPAVNPSVNCAVIISGVHNGNFVIKESGIYRFFCQLYYLPPASASARVSTYLRAFDHGTDGLANVGLKVANEETPGGQHPSISLDFYHKVEVAEGALRFFSFGWYFADGAGVTPTLTIPTGDIYTWASVEKVA